MAEKFKPKYTRVAQLKTAIDLKNYLSTSNVALEFDDELITGEASPFRKTITLKSGKKIGNALSILPMEGWDGTADGRPSDLTKHRWENFAISGAKLLWGCEAVAVSYEGRANPRQLVMKLIFQNTKIFTNLLLINTLKNLARPMIYWSDFNSHIRGVFANLTIIPSLSPKFYIITQNSTRNFI